VRRLLAVAVSVAALAGAGCGDDEEFDPIPADDADALIQQLDQVADGVDRGRCGGPRFQVGELEEKVARLPDGIDPDLRQALEDGLARLRELVDEECGRDEEDQETDTQETETVPTETVTVPTETEPEPTETEPMETQPTETEIQPTIPDGGGQPGPPGQGGGAPPGQDGDD
jgi:hypothetical protein